MKIRSIKIPFVLKLFVSLALLFVLLFTLDLATIARILSQSDLYLVVAAICSLFLFFVINTYKWQALLAHTGSTASYKDLLHLNLLGQFYNMILPGQVGGEVVKSLRLRNFNVSSEHSAVSVLADRATGLLALLLLGLGGLLFSFSGNQSQEIFLPWVLLLVFLLAGLVVFLLTGRGPGALVRLSAALHLSGNRWVSAVLRHLTSLGSEQHTWRSIYRPLVLSFVAQIIVVLLNVLVCLSLGIQLPLPAIMWISAVVLVAQALPISVAGVGVREGMYVYMLVQQGVPAQTALAVSILVFVTQIALALLGGLTEFRALIAEKRAVHAQ